MPKVGKKHFAYTTAGKSSRQKRGKENRQEDEEVVGEHHGKSSII